MSPDTTTPGAGDARFVTTHWSVVLAAGQTDVSRAQGALARLCQTYWYPLYAYIRRRGYSPHDSQDLTQAFFAHVLERQALASADPNRGRFRSFILTALNNFLATEWEKAHALKRGGGRQVISLDMAAAEQRFDLEPVDPVSPDQLFEKQWALALLDQVLSQLEAEYTHSRKAELFNTLKQTLTGTSESQPYSILATKLAMSESAVKVAVHRLRKRYRELLRIEITNTVADPDQTDEELRELFNVLSG